jgi:hypothetical protein
MMAVLVSKWMSQDMHFATRGVIVERGVERGVQAFFKFRGVLQT